MVTFQPGKSVIPRAREPKYRASDDDALDPADSNYNYLTLPFNACLNSEAEMRPAPDRILTAGAVYFLLYYYLKLLVLKPRSWFSIYGHFR